MRKNQRWSGTSVKFAGSLRHALIAAIEPLEARCLLSSSPIRFDFTQHGIGTVDGYIGGLTVVDGNIYGYCGVNTTGTDFPEPAGTGIFEVPAGSTTPTLLGTFDSSGSNGKGVSGSLVLDGSSLYGTTADGGTNNDGVIFKLDLSTGTITALSSFDGTNGTTPHGGLTLVGDTFYGVTESGGTNNDGTVFSIPVDGNTITTVASFSQADGVTPDSTLVADNAGNLYGATKFGGPDASDSNNGSGTLFEIASGANTISEPVVPLIGFTLPGQDLQLAINPATGDLFGDSSGGMFEAPKGLFALVGVSVPPAASDQYSGTDSIARDSNGNLFSCWNAPDYGHVYELSANGVVTDLASIATPGSLTVDNGNLYGAESQVLAGDSGLPDVFEIPNIAAGPPAKLVIAQQPGTAVVGGSINPAVTVDVEDANGNILTADNSNVTLSIASGSAGAVLGGTTTVQAQNGVATFSDLSISAAGGYTLSATDGSLSSATTGIFSVTELAPTLNNVKLPSSVVAGADLEGKMLAQITNQGNDFKGNINLQIFADTGAALDGNEVLLETLGLKNVSIKSGKQKAIALNINSQTPLPPGTYHLLAEVIDPTGAKSIAATTQTVQVMSAFIQPSVQVSAVTPNQLAAGKFGSLIITVTNDGNTAADGLVISLSPSTDGIAPVAGVTLNRVVASGTIKPNKSKTFHIRFKVPSSLPAGVYFPFVSVSLGGVMVTQSGASSFTVG